MHVHANVRFIYRVHKDLNTEYIQTSKYRHARIHAQLRLSTAHKNYKSQKRFRSTDIWSTFPKIVS